MSLTRSADGGVAGHISNGVQIDGKENGMVAQPGGGKGGFQFFRGRKAGFLVYAHGRRHLLQIVQGRPFLVAFPLALGSFRFPVYHALYAVLFRCVYGGFVTL